MNWEYQRNIVALLDNIIKLYKNECTAALRGKSINIVNDKNAQYVLNDMYCCTQMTVDGIKSFGHSSEIGGRYHVIFVPELCDLLLSFKGMIGEVLRHEQTGLACYGVRVPRYYVIHFEYITDVPTDFSKYGSSALLSGVKYRPYDANKVKQAIGSVIPNDWGSSNHEEGTLLTGKEVCTVIDRYVRNIAAVKKAIEESTK